MNEFYVCLNNVFSNKILAITLLIFLIYATYTDVKYLKIYNKFNGLLVLVRILFIFLPNASYKLTFDNILASLTVFIIFLSIAMMFMHKMGGDIKFISAFMLFFNMEYMLVFSLIASVLNMIYSVLLNLYLRKKQKALVNNCGMVSNYLLSLFVRIFVLNIPNDAELLEMDSKDFNKYKLPFAPFFLLSYLITYILYLINI